MLTALLGLFLLITIAWAVHGSQAALERSEREKHYED